MHLLVVYNPRVGLSASEESDLHRALAQAGHRATLIAGKKLSGAKLMQHMPASGFDLMVVAGGDGTVGKALRHTPRPQTPTALLPFGTANNIARSLGVTAGISHLRELPSLLPHLSPVATKSLAVASISGAGKQRFFVESVGCGVLTQLIGSGKAAVTDSERMTPDAELRHRIAMLQTLLREHAGQFYTLEIDGRDCSGKYLLVEAMNISRVGPGLHLAPEADAGAARLNLVLIGPEQKSQLQDYLDALLDGRQPINPFRSLRCRSARVRCLAADLHIDDKCLKQQREQSFQLTAGAYVVPIVN